MRVSVVRKAWIGLLCWAFVQQANAASIAPLEQCAADQLAPQALLDAINRARAHAVTCGTTPAPAAAPLQWNDRLAEAAVIYAKDIAIRDAVTHTGRGGESLPQRMQRVGYRYSMAGENLAAGQDTIQDAVAAWIKSPSHCTNVMMPWFSEVGLACVVRPGSRYQVYWVAHFGTELKE